MTGEQKPGGLSTTPDLAGLCERLRATRVTYRYKDGYPVKTAKRANPDGPEAAAAIERLAAENAAMREALDPFARIIPSSFYASDGSEGENYFVVLHDNSRHDQPDFSGADLSRARTALEGASDDR